MNIEHLGKSPLLTRENTTGIILAGGKSSRLGFDKGLVMVDGKTLTERAAEVLSVFCQKLIISSNKADYDQFGFERVADIMDGNGPMMGIYSSLLRSDTKNNLVMAVDNIKVGTSFFKYLIQNLKDCQAAVPYIDNRFFEPLVGYYNRNIVLEMKRMVYQNNLKLPDLLKNSNTIKLNVQENFADYSEDYFRSANSPDDLAYFGILV